MQKSGQCQTIILCTFVFLFLSLFVVLTDSQSENVCLLLHFIFCVCVFFLFYGQQSNKKNNNDRPLFKAKFMDCSIWKMSTFRFSYLIYWFVWCIFLFLLHQNMRGAWTINPIPAAQQNHYSTNQQPIQSLPKPPDDYIANDLVGKHGYWPQNMYFNRKANATNDVIQPHHHQPQMVFVGHTKKNTRIT